MYLKPSLGDADSLYILYIGLVVSAV